MVDLSLGNAATISSTLNENLRPIEKGVLQPKTFRMEWKIERFFVDCEEIGDSYESPVFPIKYASKVANWCLKVYPKGFKEEHKNHVSLYLFFGSTSLSKVTVDHELAIVCERNRISRSNRAKTCKGPKEAWGWPKFVEHDIIKDPENGALIDDTLTISCEITFHPIAKNEAEYFIGYNKWLSEIKNGLRDYKKLVENNHFSDMTFDIQGRKMYLHKAVLMSRNSFFKAMFEHEMRENKEGSVDITDFDYEVMKELFRFIYSGEVENIEKIAKELLIAADKYCVTELKVLCEKTLYDNLALDNVIECLKLADMCETLHLKKIAIKFVVDNVKDIVPKCDFKLLFAELSREVVCEIMETVAKKINS